MAFQDDKFEKLESTGSELTFLDVDYYWRQYFGTVPSDAVLAGKGLNGKNIYIGQVYIKDAGLIVVQIIPGDNEVYAPYHGIRAASKYIKILCGPQEKFYWMRATSKHLHVQVTDKHAVIGGHEDKRGYLNIGRISHAGEVKIGKVNSFRIGRASLYYNDSASEKRVESYEILMYERENTDIDVRILAE